MNKREFIRTLGLGAFGWLAWDLLALGRSALAGRLTRERKFWAWIPANPPLTAEGMKMKFALMRQSGITAILPEVYRSRVAYYASAHLPVGEAWLEKLLPLAKAEGLEVHAWIWSMPCNIEEVCREHRDWFMVNRKGESAAEKPAYVNYYKFLCPSHPEVHEFLKTTVSELCQYEALDGIHLDYIRYPDVILPQALQPRYGLKQDREYPEFDYCYCDFCRRAFKEKTGQDPMALEDPAANVQWRQFRNDTITRLVNTTLIPVAHSRKKLVTAAVFPDWQFVRQQWPVWNTDGVLPMLYHRLYDRGVEWIREETERGVQSLGGRSPLYSGILVSNMDADEFTLAIEAGLEGGADGVSLFHGNAMTEDQWKVFRRVVEDWETSGIPQENNPR